MQGDHAALGLSGVRRGLVDERGAQFGVHLCARIVDVCSVKGQKLIAKVVAVFIEQFDRVQRADKRIIRGQQHRCQADERRCGAGKDRGAGSFAGGNRATCTKDRTAHAIRVACKQFGCDGIEAAVFCQRFQPSRRRLAAIAKIKALVMQTEPERRQERATFGRCVGDGHPQFHHFFDRDLRDLRAVDCEIRRHCINRLAKGIGATQNDLVTFAVRVRR